MGQPRTGHSIKIKLTLLILITSFTLLTIVSVVVLIAEVFATRTAMVQELRTLSTALAANTRKSLILGKYREAETLLTALASQKYIHAAYLFTEQGTPVAEYLAQNNTRLVWTSLEHDFASAGQGFRMDDPLEQIRSSFSHLSILTPIYFEGNRVGSLYLLSDLEGLYGRLSGVGFGITLSLMLLFGCSWFLAGRLHKPISKPLLDLAEVMQKVSDQRNYSLRAERVTDDEIALLVDGLNHMLEEVEMHQQAQGRVQEHLAQTVDQRTAELQKAIAELEKARQQADAANQAKSHFLSRMTHELRTPLISVLGINALLQRTPLNGHQQMLVEIAGKSGEDLLALISDVLDLARIESGKLELESEVIQPWSIIEDVAELLAPQARGKGVDLVVDIPVSAVCAARGDRVGLRQIVMNLIGNAVKFTRVGTVKAALRVDAGHNSRGIFIIEVADTGIGMDEATAQRVFDLFYQHEGGALDPGAGSGLGLSIVKQLVDLMRGHLSLSSKPGEGSLFRVELELPLVADAESDIPQVWAGWKALVGMPETRQRFLLVQKLAAFGFDALTADSIEELRRLIQELANERTLVFVDAGLHPGLPVVDFSCGGLSTVVQIGNKEESSDPVSDHDMRLFQPVTWMRLKTLLERVSALAQSSVSAAEGNLPATDDPPGGGVLVVCRHAAVRRLVQMALARLPLKVDFSVDLEGAAEQIRAADYRLLLVDDLAGAAPELCAFLARCSDVVPPVFLLSESTVKPSVIEQKDRIGIISGAIDDGHLAARIEFLLSSSVRGVSPMDAEA